MNGCVIGLESKQSAALEDAMEKDNQNKSTKACW